MKDFLLRPICEVAPGDDGASLVRWPINFKRIETISLDRAPRRLPLKTFSPELLRNFTSEKAPVLGVPMDYPRIMGILNVTPDSFSDGGQHSAVDEAVARGLEMAREGADFIDIGGESTRPGAEVVSLAQEQDRVLPVIEGLIAGGLKAPISIDTRNAGTARAAFAAGARLWNDVSALTHDPAAIETAVDLDATVCLMHAQGDPSHMQENPSYRNVLIEINAYLEARVEACVAAGLSREKLIVDPGIGFGKTLEHNVELLSGLSAFHGIGCPVLLGVSRKRFIGVLGEEPEAANRAPGSIAAAIVGVQQGSQIIRVHDVKETRQAVAVWAVATGFWDSEQ
ncbi:MAG: dihydropteroate synthase [Pikeienuella sp.]